MVKENYHFNMEMEILVEARKGLVATTSPKRALSPMPRVEEPTSTPAPNPPPTSEPEGAVSLEKVALVLRRWPLQPPGFAPLGMDDSKIPALEDMYGPVARPIGSMLDLTALALLLMAISHRAANSEVHYHFQAQSVTRRSLSSISSQKHLEPPLKIEEP